MNVLRLGGVGPGAARNRCLEKATGSYIVFLDADDFLEPTLLEQACTKAQEDQSDIVAWDVWFYNDRFQHRQNPPDGVLSFGRLDKGEPFSWRENPDALFLAFQSWAWNKMYRRDFLVRENIRFQEIRRSEDVLFTCTALATASKISCLYDRLINYRVAREGSAMATKDRHELDFLDAFKALREELERRNLWEPLQRAYVGFAGSSCLYNLQTLRTLASVRKVFEALKTHGFDDLRIDLSDDTLWEDTACLAECRAIKDESFEEYLFHRMTALGAAYDDASAVRNHIEMDLRHALEEKDAELAASEETSARKDVDIAALRGRVASLEVRVDSLNREIDEITHCAEWRVGVVLGKVPRAIQRKIIAQRERSS